MSANFDKVKGYYIKGLWNIGMVKNAVCRWITETEYKEITGQDYTA